MKLYTNINEFKKENSKVKKTNERFVAKDRKYMLTIYCDKTIGDPEDLLDYLEMNDIDGFSVGGNDLYKTFDHYKDAMRVIHFITNGIEEALIDMNNDVDFLSEDIMKGFKLIMV